MTGNIEVGGFTRYRCDCSSRRRPLSSSFPLSSCRVLVFRVVFSVFFTIGSETSTVPEVWEEASPGSIAPLLVMMLLLTWCRVPTQGLGAFSVLIEHQQAVGRPHVHASPEVEPCESVLLPALEARRGDGSVGNWGGGGTSKEVALTKKGRVGGLSPEMR